MSAGLLRLLTAAYGTSRHFAAQHKFGSNWRRSGFMPRPPVPYQSDANDPTRSSAEGHTHRAGLPPIGG